MEPVRSKLKTGVEPAANETIIVSPTAREAARITDAAIPEIAAGKTILIAVSNFVAPSAYDQSRNEAGTAERASSERETIIGKIMMPTTIPALSALNNFNAGMKDCNHGVTTVKAKKP